MDRLRQFALFPTISPNWNFKNYTSQVNGDFIDEAENISTHKEESEKHYFCLLKMLCSILVSLTYDDDSYSLHDEYSSITKRSNVGDELRDTGID